MVNVRISEAGGFFGDVDVNEGTTVGEALRSAGVNSDAKQIRLNSNAANVDTKVSDGDTVYVVPSIKGNR
jgi:sulfur carrier protein ThiS